MANKLSTEKKTLCISALCEGSSIRSIERMTGVHRDTIMRLGVRIGEGCRKIMDEKMKNLSCSRIECDEIWGFVGSKRRHKYKAKNPHVSATLEGRGDIWTFVAIDAETKLVPSFHFGDRGYKDAELFMSDLAGRLNGRIQLSTDSHLVYREAVENSFGCEVDYGQIVKTFGDGGTLDAQRKYSPAEIIHIKRKKMTGNPKSKLISTSYIEKQNHTMRMHCRRLSRLTNAFSKKLENFKAAVSLHFAYYNFCKIHKTIQCTPAMEAGITSSIWTVRELVEMIDG